MYYNFKDKTLISLSNIRQVFIYTERFERQERYSVKIEYFDGRTIELSVENYEDALREIRSIKIMLNKKLCEENY